MCCGSTGAVGSTRAGSTVLRVCGSRPLLLCGDSTHPEVLQPVGCFSSKQLYTPF